MSAFECNLTPTRIRNAKTRSEDREPTIVDLRPFTGKAVVTFEDVPITKEARRVIKIINPFSESLKIAVVKKPKAEFNLTLQWLENEVPADSQVTMDVIWSPLKVVGTREVLEIADHFGNKKSVSIILKSCELKKLAPRKTGLALRLKAPSPPRQVVRHTVKKNAYPENHSVEIFQAESFARAISPVRRKPMEAVKSPLRNATNFQANEDDGRNLTPKNASLLFDSIKFTPLTETKPKGESKLEYLSSLPTPSTITREDLTIDATKKVERVREIHFSPEVIQDAKLALQTPSVLSREAVSSETPVRRTTIASSVCTLTSKMILEEEKEVDDATYIAGPCEINEIDIIITSESIVDVLPTSTTFKVNKSKSFIDSSSNNFDCAHPTRAFSESMREENANDKIQLAIQGSMPNLCDMSAKTMPIDQNRYYMGSHVNVNPAVNAQNISMESIVSNTDDFHEIEMCAASSRLNLHEIGLPVLQEVSINQQSGPREVPKVKTPVKPGNVLHTFSPPRNRLADDLREMYRRETYTVKQQKTPRSPYVFAIPRIPRENGMRGSSTQISMSLTSLSSSTTSIASTSSVPATTGKLYNENVLNSYTQIDPFSATTTEDPFLSSSMYLDERKLDGIEKSFKKWLNALVTIPPDLETNKDEKIDVAKLFNDVQNKELMLAPTKEIVCSRYYTARLDSLRSAAVRFFHSEEISKPLNKLAVIIQEKKLLEVHAARCIHLDLVLQRSLLELLLCFNPLWLRIGLEVVFNVQLNLHSNHDIFGLSRFIINHMFKSPYLQQKFSKYNQQEELQDKLRKHTAKHFLFVLFFLDHAKENKLIKQNPCLFIKTAPYKESNEILKKFASLVLADYGDIIRMLKRLNFTVTHKQTVIDEFDFAFKNLAIDLRDGVRLTKVMEIILLRDDLVKRVRVPAISRLQKVHNVELALKALEQADYKILGNITSKDIADGHREKTLSLLWQIIYKFRSPRFIAAAKIVQKFWRAKWLKIVIERRIRLKEEERVNAAAVILQKHFRGWKSRREVKVYRQHLEISVITFQKFTRGYLAKKKFQRMKGAAIKIQQWYKSVKVVRQTRIEYLKSRNSIVKIQKWWRRQLLSRKLIATAALIKEIRNEKNQAALKIQKYFRGYQLMKKERGEFLHARNAIIKAQQRYHCKLIMRQVSRAYQTQRNFVIKIQQIWRAKISMRAQRATFLAQKSAAIKIQIHFRSYLLMKKQRRQFNDLKNAAIVLQTHFRALNQMKAQRNQFKIQKLSVIKIQRYWRAFKQMKVERAEFLRQKSAIVSAQRRYRGKLMMKQVRGSYQEKKMAVIKVQQYWRATVMMRSQRREFQMTISRIIFIQKKFRAKLSMRREQENYRKLKSAAITLQRHFRAHQVMQKCRQDFLEIKQAVLTVENHFIARQLMKAERENYGNLKFASIIIQRWYRNIKITQKMQEIYEQKKRSTVCIQTWWRHQLLARKLEAASRLFVEIREEKLKTEIAAARKIQNFFRGFMQMKKDRAEYTSAKNAIVKVQQRYHCKLIMRQVRKDFLIKKMAAIKIQQFWQGTLQMRQQRIIYQATITRIVFIQRRVRANQAMKVARNEFLRQKNAAVHIQVHFRRYMVMKELRLKFIETKTATVKIQRFFRAYQLMKKEREEYLQARNAIIKAQQRYHCKLIMRQVSRDYQIKRNSVIKIQQIWRATVTMRAQRLEYQATVTKIVQIQRKFREKLLTRKTQKEFKALKSAVLVIQRRFRAQQKMQKCRQNYLKLKETARKVENRVIATRIMKIEREKFLKFRNLLIFIQRTFRMKLEARKLHKEFKATCKSVNLLQKHARGFLARRYYREHLATPENLENRRQQKAARQIQAAWRGYKERSKKSNFCFRAIVQRLVKVSKNIDPSQTLASKLKISIDFLKNRYDSNVAIATLVKLEYMSRTVPWILKEDAEFIAAFSYGLMAQAIRSEVDKQIIELCSCIILNLGRYRDTKEDAFQESGLITVASMLLRWCDKDCGIFNTLCTLIWVFVQCENKKKIIRKFMMMKDGEFIMAQIKQNVARKENMRRNSRRPIGFQSISLVKYKKDYQLQLSHQPQTVYSSGYITPDMMKQCRQFPTLEPDYGVVRMSPYIFYSSVFAFESVLKSLGIHSIK